MINYINYRNRSDLLFAITEIEEFKFIKEKYKEIFIDDLKNKNKVESILGYVPQSYEELLKLAKENNLLAKEIENLCYRVYSSYPDDLTLVSDVTGDNLYVIRGTQSDYDARIEKLSEIEKIYLLNTDVEDYTDIFGHKISFHINNDFIK